MKDIVVVIYYIAKLLIELIEERKKLDTNKSKHKKNRPIRPKSKR